MLEDLTMIATFPVDEAAVKKAADEGDKDKAAAGETMPAPKNKSDKAPRRRPTKVARRAGSAAR